MATAIKESSREKEEAGAGNMSIDAHPIHPQEHHVKADTYGVSNSLLRKFVITTRFVVSLFTQYKSNFLFKCFGTIM